MTSSGIAPRWAAFHTDSSHPSLSSRSFLSHKPLDWAKGWIGHPSSTALPAPRVQQQKRHWECSPPACPALCFHVPRVGHASLHLSPTPHHHTVFVFFPSERHGAVRWQQRRGRARAYRASSELPGQLQAELCSILLPPSPLGSAVTATASEHQQFEAGIYRGDFSCTSGQAGGRGSRWDVGQPPRPVLPKKLASHLQNTAKSC